MDEPRTIPIGQILKRHGVLTETQVQAILERQRTEARPFGDLAERMFRVTPDMVEKAWVEQYLSYDTEIDLDSQYIDSEVLKVINRRQAWQFRVLPMRRNRQEMVAATSPQFLRRAVNFSWRNFQDPVFFLIARRPQLEMFLMKHYPWPGAMDLPVDQSAA